MKKEEEEDRRNNQGQKFISWPTFTLLSLYHCVWSVITAHNVTPEKSDNIIIRSTL